MRESQKLRLLPLQKRRGSWAQTHVTTLQLQPLASTSRGVVRSVSNAAIQQTHLLRSHVYRGGDLCGHPMALSAASDGLVRSDTVTSLAAICRPLPQRRCHPQPSRGLVCSGRLLLLLPPRSCPQPHAHGRPSRLRPRRRRPTWTSHGLIRSSSPRFPFHVP